MTRAQTVRVFAGLSASALCLWACGGAAAQAAGPGKSVVVRPEGGSSRRVPARKLMREGTFLADRQGWLRPVGAERWAIVFDAAVDPGTGQTTVDPPMAVLPCLKTMEMRRIVEARAETVTFRVSGRVMVYKGRNYFLPTFFVTVADSVPSGGSGDGPGAAQGEISEEARREAGKAFDDMMGQGDTRKSGSSGGGGNGSNDPEALLRSVDRATPNQSVPTAGGSGEGAWNMARPGGGMAMGEEGARKLVREGTMLTSRLGRLLRGPAGELVFAPDNGVSAAPAGSGDAASGGEGNMQLGPMRLIPCLNLQEMERLTQAHPVALEFKVSGQVFVYDGKNYLLPTMYLIEVDRDGNVTPGQ